MAVTSGMNTQTTRADNRSSLRGSRGVIVLLVVSAFVVILNETIMGVALPALMSDLQITATTAQWLTTAYLLTMAAVIPITGLLIQRFSVRVLFFWAMGLFSTGTLIAALSTGFGMLLLGRVVQASGTAVMMPLLMTTILTIVPVDKRGRLMGVVSIVISVAPAVGPAISGLILSVLDWRWLFWTVLPIALATIVLGVFLVRNVTHTQSVRVDVLSVVLSTLGFGGVVFGLSSIGESAAGHAPVPPAIPLAVGAIALWAFVARQLTLQRTDRALLDLRTFSHRSFTVAAILIAVVMITLFGTLILLPIYLQNVLEIDTLTTGLILLPGGLIMGALAPFVGSLFDRFGARVLVIPGTIGLTGVLWWMTSLDQNSTVGIIVAMHVTMSVCLALMFTPLFTSALGSLPPRLYPHGSALVGTIQQVAGAIGTALFVTVMTVTAATAVSGGASEQAATADGFHSALLIGTIVAGLSAVVAFLIPRHVARSASTDITPH